MLVSCSSPCLPYTSDVWSGCCFKFGGFVVGCSTAESACRGACCAVVRAAHKRRCLTVTAGRSLYVNRKCFHGHQPMVAWRLSFRSVWSSPAAWFCPTNSQPALVGGQINTHTHMHMHSLIDACTPTGRAHTQKKLYAQHKAGCWSNYRNMAEHDEAGPTIRREIEWAEEKWWRH